MNDVFAELKADQGYGVCSVHGYGWRHGRNMANAPLGLHCPYDGSMHPDEFMAYLDKPGTELTPTDKNYKVYIDVASEEPAQMRYVASCTRRPGEGPPDDREWMTWEDAVKRHPELREEHERHLQHVESTAPSHPWRTDTHWIQVGPRGERRESKFYFEHLSAEQRTAFIQKLNAGELTLREPGFFYRLPFFVSERDA